jgi:hypothetical protein
MKRHTPSIVAPYSVIQAPTSTTSNRRLPMVQRNMTNLEVLLLRGPTGGDPEAHLNELRYTILAEGIPANSEGMVR